MYGDGGVLELVFRTYRRWVRIRSHVRETEAKSHQHHHLIAEGGLDVRHEEDDAAKDGEL